jgi:hypothetical protein
MKPHITQLKEYLKTAGTCSVLKEDKAGFPSFTADLTDLPNRTEFLKGLVALLNVPYDASKDYYTKTPSVLLNVGGVSLEELPKLFPQTVYIEIAFRGNLAVLLSLYDTRYIDTQGLLGVFHAIFFLTKMHFKEGEVFDAETNHGMEDTPVYIAMRDFNLQELTEDFVRTLSVDNKDVRTRDLIRFGLRNGYWTTPIRKIDLHVGHSPTAVFIRASDGINTARSVAARQPNNEALK